MMAADGRPVLVGERLRHDDLGLGVAVGKQNLAIEFLSQITGRIYVVDALTLHHGREVWMDDGPLDRPTGPRMMVG